METDADVEIDITLRQRCTHVAVEVCHFRLIS